MSHDDDVRTLQAARTLHDALLCVPPLERVVALAVSIIDEEPRAPDAISFLITVAQVMAKHLPPEQRTAVVWHLNAAAAELEARWN